MKGTGISKPLLFYQHLLLYQKCIRRLYTKCSIAPAFRFKSIVLGLVMITLLPAAYTQNHRADTVATLLASTRRDTNMVWLLKRFSNYYIETRADTALLLAQKGVSIAKEIHFLKGEVELLKKMAGAYATAGNYANALETHLQALDIARDMNDPVGIADGYHKIGLIFNNMEEHQQALSFFYQERAALTEVPLNESDVWNTVDLAATYASLRHPDSTRFFTNEAYAVAVDYFKGDLPGDFLNSLADLYFKMGNDDKALLYYRQSILKKDDNYLRNVSQSALGIAQILNKKGKTDSALYYAQVAFSISQQFELPLNMLQCANFLSTFYKNASNIDSAFFYQQLAGTISYQLFSTQKIKNFHSVYFSYRQKEQEMAIQQAQSRQRLRFYMTIAAVLLLTGLAVLIMYFRNREKHMRLQQALLLEQKQKEKKLVEWQHEKSELEMQFLRAQMNPHFIFNVLNSINHFILTHESEAASDYLVKFSRLMRMVLNISQKNEISLQQELEYLELYIQLEQLRFENAFRYSIHCPAAIDTEETYMPPLLLQPFVENAIWHGLMHKKEGGATLRIEIRQQGQMLHFVITDNGIGRKQAAALKSKSAAYKKSMGMQIIANRLQMLNREKSPESLLKIIDLKDKDGTETGTQVIIQVPIKIHENTIA